MTTTRKHWHRDFMDPMYRDPPEIPEDVLEQYLDDMVYEVERSKGMWSCEVTWGHINVTQTEGDTYSEAMDEALKRARSWAMDREYKEIGL